MEAVGGWVVAAFTAALAAAVWYGLSTRMEAVARACHELRGPLTAARLGLQLGTRTSQISVDRLRAIDLELGRAALALDDLADVPAARSARHRSRLGSFEQLVDVGALVADSVEAWRPAAVSSRTQLSLGWMAGRARVRGDRLRLAQAIENLIANAIEHGGEGVVIRGAVVGHVVQVEVADDGPGLPPRVEDLVLFGAGRRWKSIRHGSGRGRGLAIACGVAEAHGGRLSSGGGGRGTRLALELPLAAPLGAAEVGPERNGVGVETGGSVRTSVT
jgi:signal transduction histidine kinase